MSRWPGPDKRAPLYFGSREECEILSRKRMTARWTLGHFWECAVAGSRSACKLRYICWPSCRWWCTRCWPWSCWSGGTSGGPWRRRWGTRPRPAPPRCPPGRARRRSSHTGWTQPVPASRHTSRPEIDICFSYRYFFSALRKCWNLFPYIFLIK